MLQAAAKLNANFMRVEEGQLLLSTRRQALARARRMIREYIPDHDDLTQSLIDDRHEEAKARDGSRP